MSALAAIQADFQDYILGTAGPAPAIVDAVNSQRGVGAIDRLGIYHRAYRLRMREALCEAFDKTWTYAGDDLFDGLAESYLTAHPSGYRNLRWFGDTFASHAAQALPDYPFVAELADLEWTLGLAFDAPDTAALGMDDLRATPAEQWGELTFGLHPAVGFLTMAWNTVTLWQALHDDAEPPGPEQLVTARSWLVWRAGDQPHFRSLDALEAQALRRLGEGASFAQVCLEAASDDSDPTLRMAGYLQNWLAQGLLTVRQAQPSVRI